MNVTFLGSASCYPTTSRGVSCTALRFEDGDVWLFDCGEGSQVQLQKCSIHIKNISKIFITHLHGDHLFGLPGLICTLGSQLQDVKGYELEIYGPEGLRRYLRESLNISRSPLPFKYSVHELVILRSQFPSDWEDWKVLSECDGPSHPQEVLGRNIIAQEGVWELFTDKKVSVKAGPLKHKIPCFGFAIKEFPSPGKLDHKYLSDKGVKPGPLYGKIKRGEDITLENGDVIKSADVLGPEKPGRLVIILGDTCESSGMARLSRGCDLLIHEATLEDALKEKALEHGHSTPSMAAKFAAEVGAKTLILFHFSQRYKPLGSTLKKDVSSVSILLDEAKSTFESLNSECNVVLAFDLMEYQVTRPPQEYSTGLTEV